PLRHFANGLLALVLTACATTQAPAPEAYLEDVKFLSSSELKGRGAGTPELDQAAAYIAKKFEEAGLQPAGEKGFLQPLQVTTGAVMGADNHLAVSGEAVQLSEDYSPISFS